MMKIALSNFQLHFSKINGNHLAPILNPLGSKQDFLRGILTKWFQVEPKIWQQQEEHF